MTRTFNLSCLCLWHLFGVFGFQTDGVKTVSGTEGDSVTLHTDVTEVVGRDVILWTTLGYNIARFNRASQKISKSDGPNGIFRNRLHVTFRTGDLIINDVKTEHSGLYEVKIMQGNKVSYKRYKVEVHVVNVTQVTLSWYKGNSLFSSISVSDLNSSLSLHLECVNDSYSCVVNNSISNQTKHLDISTDLCQPCSDHCCSLTEAVIRLVISGLVGVACVAVLVYDIRSRRTEQKRYIRQHHQTRTDKHD
ncbi:uncharacterized protein LOC127439158 isoform X2 [Myxocyprinus asiaticus]|uniref:uncharacterized protein LOC127439158 isoform X2 n=1 Tax=Myxocyprinus asiaticus TaxID=70543 RepID=UPI0022227684|nr:uncharacterized protein LOC127439158 isoform X2 [Myxocyprinus asiaticus]